MQGQGDLLAKVVTTRARRLVAADDPLEGAKQVSVDGEGLRHTGHSARAFETFRGGRV